MLAYTNSDIIRFTIYPEHIQLLQHMWVDWCDDEFGAPEIDPKRPYGNSDVIGDIREIIDQDLTDEEAHLLHRDTQTALQIALKTGSFVPGEYEADKYSRDWKPVVKDAL